MNSFQLFCIPKQILNTLSVCMTQILLFLCLNISICLKNRSRSKNDGKLLGVLVLVQNMHYFAQEIVTGEGSWKNSNLIQNNKSQ